MLPEVEVGKRCLTTHAGGFQLHELGIVALCLPMLVIEVFDCLVIDQTINGATVGGTVVFVDGAPDVDAPVAHLDRKNHVGGQGSQGDQDKDDVVTDKEDAEDQEHFDQRGQDGVERVGNQAGDGARAPFEVARDAAGLAR